MEEIRLQKFLANAGIASRRKSEELINKGRITINGQIAKIGAKVNIEKDVVVLDGNQIKLNDEKIYILLNKPVGYVTTVKDQYNRQTVLDLVDINERIVPARKTGHVYIWSIDFK